MCDPEFEEYKDILNFDVLEVNQKVQKLLMHEIKSIGFCQGEISRGEDNYNLIKGALCAGLWPNIGIPNTEVTDRMRLKVHVNSKEDLKLEIGHRSVNAEGSFLAEEEPEVIVFRDVYLKIDGSGVLNDTTVVPALAVAWLGEQHGSIQVVYPTQKRQLYKDFEAEVRKAVNFRLKNPGKWGDRDEIMVAALGRCLEKVGKKGKVDVFERHFAELIREAFKSARRFLKLE